MKKIFLFAALTAAVLSSCTNDDDVIQSSTASNVSVPHQIAFVTNKAATRAGDVTSLTSFKVTGVTSTGSGYFTNETFSFANNMFSSSTPYYWPISGTMDFYATNTGNIAYASGTASIDIQANDGTVDAVAATYKGAASTLATVPLTFKHIYSRLTVKVKPFNTSDGYDYFIGSVKVNWKSTGKYTFSNTTGTVGSWSNTKDYKQYSFTTGLPAQTGKTTSGHTISLPQAFYLIPSGGASDVLGFSVEYRVYKNGVLVADCTGDNAGTIEIDNPDLGTGKSLCYVLEPSFDSTGRKSIAFTATVTPWGSAVDVDNDIEL